jgi:phage terminase small subunit
VPALANHKHELFAQALAKGDNATNAYKNAGYTAKGNAAESAASRLLSDVKVQARVTELQERAAIKAGKTAADIVAMLEEDRTLARSEKQPSAAVSAALGMAKVLGLITDKVKHEGSVNWVQTLAERRARA